MWEMNYDQSCLGVFGDYKVCWNCIEDVEIVNFNADRACLTSRAINSIIWRMKGTCLILSRMWRKKIKVEIWVLMNMTWFVSVNPWLPLFNPLFFFLLYWMDLKFLCSWVWAAYQSVRYVICTSEKGKGHSRYSMGQIEHNKGKIQIDEARTVHELWEHPFIWGSCGQGFLLVLEHFLHFISFPQLASHYWS